MSRANPTEPSGPDPAETALTKQPSVKWHPGTNFGYYFRKGSRPWRVVEKNSMRQISAEMTEQDAIKTIENQGASR